MKYSKTFDKIVQHLNETTIGHGQIMYQAQSGDILSIWIKYPTYSRLHIVDRVMKDTTSMVKVWYWISSSYRFIAFRAFDTDQLIFEIITRDNINPIKAYDYAMSIL